jgi:toxin CcdB
MAQFDVHRNTGAHKEDIPFVVVVQSSLFDNYRRRVVVPLVRRRALPASTVAAGTRTNPEFRIKGVDVVLHPLDIVSARLDQLGPKVASLAGEGHAITDAIDEVLTRSWG